MPRATKLTLILLSVLLFANARAFNGSGGKLGGGMGGKMGMPQPAAEEAGDGKMADMNPEVVGAFMPTRANPGDMKRRGFFDTGLKPRYPADANCPVITSGFADPRRTDGSIRSPRYYQGLHSGVDIPAPEGTPVVAMADGTVVRMGEEIGQAGISGTAGYYGEEGFSHLHLSAWYSEGDEYKAGRMFVPAGGQWMDPLALLRGLPLDSDSVEKLPNERKQVAFAYQTGTGEIRPANARVIWPFVCQPK